jgi:hypothetical protein
MVRKQSHFTDKIIPSLIFTVTRVMLILVGLLSEATENDCRSMIEF